MLEIIPGVNTGFGYMNIFGLAPGGAYVASLGSTYGVRGREDLGMISGKRWGRRVKKY